MLRILATAALCAAPPAFAQTGADGFDPSLCPADADGTVTIRLVSGLAFALPADRFGLRDASPPSEDASLPPYGCPGNPIVTRAASTWFDPLELLPEGHEPVYPLRFNPFTLSLFGHDEPTRIQESNLYQFTRMYDWQQDLENCVGANRFTTCEAVPGGILDQCFHRVLTEGARGRDPACPSFPAKASRTRTRAMPAGARSATPCSTSAPVRAPIRSMAICPSWSVARTGRGITCSKERRRWGTARSDT